ncbi:unnamed protein product [Sphagnum jensenii]|uniref:Uncharacterized protein n=1 Tax=Sphagnum jensenii TaxID=128206 RepID=A0ABP0WDY3_9BRYO
MLLVVVAGKEDDVAAMSSYSITAAVAHYQLAAQLGNSWDDDEEIQDLSQQQLLMTINLQISWQAGY